MFGFVTMDGFMQKKQTCTPQQATAMTESILNMLINDIRAALRG